jgi:hypothetical protein
MHIHVIAFDIPLPADYGGVMDVFYKIKAMHSLGVKIHLHCFKYGRSELTELDAICEKVYYYERKLKKQYLFSRLPFIVASRTDESLLQRLLQDEYPILFEGLHTCSFLNDKRIENRLKIVRMHNVEHEYYMELAQAEEFGLKKIYFQQESIKLKEFEKILTHANYILAISEGDKEKLNKKYKHVLHVGAFHPNKEVNIISGIGHYCLYHGNLSVNENSMMAMMLAEKIFSRVNTPLIIAGKNPTEKLKRAIEKFKNIELKPNPDDNEMLSLIKNAQINILPAAQSSGIKLKLLNALFNGRHCVVNDKMVLNTGLAELCVVKNTADEMLESIIELMHHPINNNQIANREKTLLLNHFNNSNAKKILDLL